MSETLGENQMRSDADLVECWQQGDRRAADELAKRHFDLLFRFFVNKVVDSEDVGELINQSFLACAQGIASYRRESSFRRFLLGISMNTYRVYLRKHQKREREAGDYENVCVGTLSQAGLSTLLARHQAAQIFMQALREIPLEDQALLEFRYFLGLNSREIALLFDAPAATICTRLARSRDRLEAQLLESLARQDLPSRFELDHRRLEDWSTFVRQEFGWADRIALQDKHVRE